MIKRAFDLVAATIGLVVLSPVMAVIAVLIKRDSEGPVIFKQVRVGLHGKPFTLFKFRSMAQTQEFSGPLLTAATDPRITRVGALLRSTKLDELPQLVNVVRGEMSLVGPRPEVAEYVALWPSRERRLVLSVRPGVTDPATVQLRRESELLASAPDPEAFYVQVLVPQKTRAYVDYVLHRTLVGDLRLIVETLVQVVRG